MNPMKNEVYALVDEKFISGFSGHHLTFMRKHYFENYCKYCDAIGRKPLDIDTFYTNMHRRRIQLYQVCCPYCGSVFTMIHDKKTHGNGGGNYCSNCGRGSAVENIIKQVSRFIRIHGINRLGLKEFKKEHKDTEEWLLAYDCYQMEIISLASIIEVVLRDYYEALLFINNFGVSNDYTNKLIKKQIGNDFMNIEKANDIYKKTFGVSIKDALDNNEWLDLLDIVNLRNMMVHNNGRIDERFKLSSTYTRNVDKVIDLLYKLEEKDIAGYLGSVISSVTKITNLFLEKYYESRGKVIVNHYFNQDLS